MSLTDLFADAPAPPVPNSSELQRILRIPRRTAKASKELTQAVSSYFRLPGSSAVLRPVQALALYEAAQVDGLLGLIGLGHGKTLLSLLLPEAMDSRCAVLLVPSQLRKKTIREVRKFYSSMFRLPSLAYTTAKKRVSILERAEGIPLHVQAYEELSSARTRDLLDVLEPDLIILDEAQCLSNRHSARTGRFLRYMDANPLCRLAALSGTMTDRCLTDYSHFSELALGRFSPLPSGYYELLDWNGAIAVDPDEPRSPGALKALCLPGEPVRKAFARRLVETLGVVATTGQGFDGKLMLKAVKPKIPAEIKRLRKELTNTWEIGDVVITQAPHFARTMKQLAVGFYYRWDWPGEPDREWLDIRQNWHKELRYFLKYRAKAGLDSPLLVCEALEKGQIKAGKILDAHKEWLTVAHRPKPPTVAVWIDRFVVDFAKSWSKTGIIWFFSKALEEAFRETDLPVYGEGDDASEATAPLIVCGVASQGKGKNLQRYRKNLMLEMPSNGKIVEQWLGRTHRPGQVAEEVEFHWLAHVHDFHRALDSAIQDCQYRQETTMQDQKLLLARFEGDAHQKAREEIK